jgi:hypothetical protein
MVFAFPQPEQELAGASLPPPAHDRSCSTHQPAEAPDICGQSRYPARRNRLTTIRTTGRATALALGAVILFAVMSLSVVLPGHAIAHPGDTDSRGGHVCQTDCAKWGEVDGAYHLHRSRPYPAAWSTAPSPTPAASPDEEPQEGRWFDAWPLFLLLAAIAPGSYIILSLWLAELKDRTR